MSGIGRCGCGSVVWQRPSCCWAVETVAADTRPNILWIIVDDMSANFSCYGETLIETPHVDGLAGRGVKFTHAYVTAPVCSPNRSAFITGMYQTTIGAHHHRSGRGRKKIDLPEGSRPIPVLFREAGYYTSISGWPNKPGTNLGKTDYNFEWDRSMYDGPDWSGRQEGQPFFAQIQLPGGKHRGGTRESARRFAARSEEMFGSTTSPEAVMLPPYLSPRPGAAGRLGGAISIPCAMTDRYVGEVIAPARRTKAMLDNTVVLFMTDHGISHARGKQFLYDEGIHVPLVIAGPGISPGQVRDDLVEHIDMAAMSLALAGIEVPERMQARDILAADVQAARSRLRRPGPLRRNGRPHPLRADRALQVHPQLPSRAAPPAAQPLQRWQRHPHRPAGSARRGHARRRAGTALAPTRPPRSSTISRPIPTSCGTWPAILRHQQQLAAFRRQLDEWIVSTGDHGPESDAMYDSDMAAYLNPKAADSPREEILRQNIALMKQWAAEGK